MSSGKTYYVTPAPATVHYWNVGDKVVRRKGMRSFNGTILSVFHDLSGVNLYLVVESSAIPGFVQIFEPTQVRKKKEP